MMILQQPATFTNDFTIAANCSKLRRDDMRDYLISVTGVRPYRKRTVGQCQR